jgi:predicted DNA-binding transcriptional regulator AlpA
MKHEHEAKLISTKEAAALTGMSQGWWRDAVNGRKPMPPVRVVRFGGAVRLHLGDLLRYIEKGTPIQPRRRRGRPRKTEIMANHDIT